VEAEELSPFGQRSASPNEDRRMRRFRIAAAVLSLAAPAGAQIAGRHDYGPVGSSDPFLPDSSFGFPGLGRELRDIEGHIEDGRQSGQLSRTEARQLRRDARRLGFAGRRYGRDGLSASERSELQARALALRAAVNAARLTTDRPRGRRGRS
jgi:hypothetical protein